MIDLFAVIRGLDCVARVTNLYPAHPLPLNLLFFICPKLSNKGLTLNRLHTGLTGRYVNGLGKSTETRLDKVRQFAGQLEQVGIEYTVTAIFAAADSLILFPHATAPPPLPEIDGLRIISNLEAVRDRLRCFAELYEQEAWRSAPEKVWQAETERLVVMLLPDIPDNIRQDFAKRVLAGFALDGLLMKEGHFGARPVILGVESPGVAILQNAALPREQWLPIIQLR